MHEIGERQRSIPVARPARSAVAQVAHALLVAGFLIVVSAASIVFALRVTPQQSVSALGQTVEVGTAAPSLSTSGPGEVVLFGRSLPTQVHFIGPVRPNLVLTDISLNDQVSGLFSPGSGSAAAAKLGDALADGWRRYFVWEIVFVALGALVLVGAIAGWRRYGWRKTVIAVAGGLLFVEVVNVGAIMVTAYTAPGILHKVHSLGALVGRDGGLALPAAPGPALPRVQAVVLGDSTAAGLGGPPLAEASRDDEACGRSASSFAITLARVNGWKVDDLACSGATIDHGILGPENAGGHRIPPQLAVAKRESAAKAVVVSVGANDLNWSTLVRLCAASTTCDDRATTAYFQRSLDGFTQSYYELLRELETLPGHPVVVINQYYLPFDPTLDCLSSSGLAGAKIEVLLARLRTLNTILANGADTFGYRTVQPDFRGHELCTDQSYVQGADDPAPLHPNARGELVIALADERALLGAA